MFLPDWRQAWRWWSVRVSAIGAILMAAAIAAPDVLNALWTGLPPELRALVPDHLASKISLGLFVLTIAARLLPQPAPGAWRGLFRSTAGAVKPKTAGKIAAAALAIIAATMSLEGGYVFHPADPGGETNRGVTKRVAVEEGYRGPMRTLPKEVATSIHYRRYLVAPGFLPMVDLAAPVAAELFDTAVNMGPARPSGWFQQGLNDLCAARLVVDGRVGPATIAAYRACRPRLGPARLCLAMLARLDDRQAGEYDRLVAVNPKLRVFRRGWQAHRIGNVDRATCSAVAA